MSEEFEVCAISLVGDRAAVAILPTTTVAEFKQKLDPAQVLKVLFNGTALRDEQILAECGVEQGSIVHWCVMRECSVFVQKFRGERVLLSIALTHRVDQFKTVLAFKLAVPWQRIKPFYNGKPMRDEQTLAECGVEPGSVVFWFDKGPDVPGGRCLFVHGLRANPMPNFKLHPACCDRIIKFEMLTCDELVDVHTHVMVKLNQAELQQACSPLMVSYLQEGSHVCIWEDDQVVCGRPPDADGGVCWFREGGLLPNTVYKVTVHNLQGAGVGWTFKTKCIEK